MIKPLSLLGLVSLTAWLIYLTVDKKIDSKKKSYIVSASSYTLLQTELASLDIKPTHHLAIINAVAVILNDQQLLKLQARLAIQVTTNHKVELSGRAWGKRKWQPKAVVPDYIDATSAHSVRNFGDGVTIGFLDTGLDQLSGLSTDLYGKDKAWGTYDAINNTVSNYDDEASGHGTHVASIAANSDYDVYGKIYGVAPNAALVGIKAFDGTGKGTYADVIRGIDWALQVKDEINLKVLNMSFSGPVRSYYWEDPLNQAVMKAWQAGIVVVASAGNTGPDPMTIGVPGNVPYIITVGAITDNYTSNNFDDDKIATFSAAGPTVEGFVKPEIIAPGGHLSGLMSYDSQIVMEHPEFHDGGRYFEMSGTSQAAAVVSGVVALLLTNDPTLTPDEVKCRLMDSAHHAVKADGTLAYSVFQQGAGVVNVNDALLSSASSCANQALNIAQDLSGENHYFGPANINEAGDFYIEGLGQEYVWNIEQSNVEGDGLLWKTNFDNNVSHWQNTATTDGLLWKTNFETNGLLWKTGFGTDGLLWKTSFDVDGLLWKTSVDINGSDSIGINNWVIPQ
ncbi:MAG: serine protease AprX [Alteromonadaceae bacterium]|jgi:serine protease AprX